MLSNWHTQALGSVCWPCGHSLVSLTRGTLRAAVPLHSRIRSQPPLLLSAGAGHGVRTIREKELSFLCDEPFRFGRTLMGRCYLSHITVIGRGSVAFPSCCFGLCMWVCVWV